MGRSSVITLGKHPRCIGHKRNKVNSSRIGEDHAALPPPGVPALLEGPFKHVESLHREGPRLHAFPTHD